MLRLNQKRRAQSAASRNTKGSKGKGSSKGQSKAASENREEYHYDQSKENQETSTKDETSNKESEKDVKRSNLVPADFSEVPEIPRILKSPSKGHARDLVDPIGQSSVLVK